MDTNENHAAPVSDFTAKQSGDNIISDVIKGRFGILSFTVSHFLAFALCSFFIFDMLSNAATASLSFGFVALIVSFLIIFHMVLGYIRIFILGNGYAHFWVTQPDTYSEVQSKAARKIYPRFLLVMVIFGLPLWLGIKVEGQTLKYLYSFIESELLVMVAFSVVGYVIWLATLALVVLLGFHPFGRCAIGAEPIKISEEIAQLKKKVAHLLTVENIDDTRIYLLIGTVLLWVPRYIQILSDTYEWLYVGRSQPVLRNLVFAMDTSVFNVLMYLVIAGLIAFFFVKTYPDARDEILAKSDEELLKHKAKAESGGGFMAAMDDKAPKE